MRATMGGLQGFALIVTGIVGAVLTYKAIKGTAAAAGTVREAVSSAVAAINPANPNNVINRTVNQTVQNLTGDSTATLGTKLAEWFDPVTRAADAALAQPAGVSRSQFNALSQLSVFDQEDADQGAAMRANQLGIPFVGAADLDDAELGFAMRTGGQQVGALSMSPGFSYLTRTGKNF